MSKRTLLIIIPGCLLAIIALWLVIPGRVPETDAARYKRWKGTLRWSERALWWADRLPRIIGRQLDLSARAQKHLQEHERLKEALLASGYVTNVVVEMDRPMTNYVQRAQLARRLRKVSQGMDDWEFLIASNAVFITCRTHYVSLIRQALQQ